MSSRQTGPMEFVREIVWTLLITGILIGVLGIQNHVQNLEKLEEPLILTGEDAFISTSGASVLTIGSSGGSIVSVPAIHTEEDTEEDTDTGFMLGGGISGGRPFNIIDYTTTEGSIRLDTTEGIYNIDTITPFSLSTESSVIILDGIELGQAYDSGAYCEMSDGEGWMRIVKDGKVTYTIHDLNECPGHSGSVETEDCGKPQLTIPAGEDEK